MKKIIFIYLLIASTFSSCDPAESLEANIVNNTSQDIKINFISIEEPILNETLDIKSNKNFLYWEGKSSLGGYKLSFNEFDSISIRNTSNEILKIFKEDTEGKNIYNVAKYWSLRKPSKNHFEYTYEITNEDLGLVDEHID